MMNIEMNNMELIMTHTSTGFARLKFIYDKKGNPQDLKFVDANPAFLEITGIPQKEIINERFTQVFHYFKRNLDEWVRFFYELALKDKKEVFEQHMNKLNKNVKIELFSIEEDYFTVFITDITEEKKQLKQYKNLSEKYKMLFEHSSDALFIHDQEGWILDVNENAIEILGYSSGELKSMNIKDLSPESEQDYIKKTLQKINPHQTNKIEVQVKKKDGTLITASINTSLVDAKKGLILGSLRDITQARQRERELRKLYTAVEQGPSIVAITDLDGKLEYVNKKFQEITGYSFEEVKGRNPRILKSGDYSDRFYRELWETITNGLEWTGVFHNRRKNGELYWEEALVSPVFDKKGRIVNYVKLSQDITEKKEASEALRRNRNLLNSIINNLPGYLFVVDKDFKIMVANNNFLSIIRDNQRGQTDIIGKKCSDILTKQSKPSPDCAIYKALSTGKTVIRESTSNTPLQQTTGKSLKILVSPLRGRKNEVIGAVQYAVDITKLKEAEIKAQEASKAKSEFLAHMSHEIRTPLNGVIGFANTLKKTELDDTQLRYLENIDISANSLLEIINDILDFSKIESGKLELNPEPTNIEELLENTIKVISPKAGERNIEVLLTRKGAIPRFATVDAVRLRQIIINLLSNAVKFTEDGLIEVTVERKGFNEETKKALITFSVRDTGIGIDEKAREKIFESFSQADPSTTKRFGGTGLGLNISNKLLEMMGSRLELESEVGVGTTFSFTLALQRAAIEEIPASEREPAGELSKSNNRKIESAADKPLKVLITEDNELNMELTEIIVNDLFEEVDIIQAVNGKEAVKQYKKHTPDIILMDIQMPEMNGYEATKQIRATQVEKTEAPFIIALTAATIKGEKEKALEAGMDDYLTKPVAEEALKQAILKYKGLQIKNDVPADESTPQHFNKFALCKILKNRRSVIDRIIETGKRSLYQGEQKLTEAFEQKDRESIKQSAHKLKGMASNMRFEILQQLSTKLENDAGSPIPVAFHELEGLYLEIKKEIDILKQLV